MEIYRNEPTDLYLYVRVGSQLQDADATPIATLESDLETSPIDRTPIVSKVSTGKYKIGLLNSDVNCERTLLVTWEYEIEGTPEVQTQEYNVVSAYSTLEDLQAIPSTVDASVEDIQMAARFAKSMIDNYTGQKFGLWYEELWLDGRGIPTLTFPVRISSINTITYNSTVIYDNALDTNDIAIDISPTSRAITIVDEADVIVPPETEFSVESNIFYNNQRYQITGWFGWNSVPQDVSDAHKLLVNDWFCNESKWRKRYIERIKLTRDSEITFDSRAYTSTGNFYADKLLEPYVMQPFVVF